MPQSCSYFTTSVFTLCVGDMFSLFSQFNFFPLQKFYLSISSIGGSRGRARRTPPYGTKFFHFHIHFQQKVPMSEVHAPRRVHSLLREILDPPLPSLTKKYYFSNKFPTLPNIITLKKLIIKILK